MKYLLIFLCLTIGCVEKNDSKKIVYDGYTIKGGDIKIVGKDTILNGVINFFDSTEKLKMIVEFKNSAKNGSYRDFFQNGNISQEINFADDKENGLYKVFDTSGKLISTMNYFYGVPIGGATKFGVDTFTVYNFFNFEGVNLYRCDWNAKDRIVEYGQLLNYVTSYENVGDDLKLVIFLYLIDPPHKKIFYKLFDISNENKDSVLVYQGNSQNSFYERVYLNPPEKGHVYVWRLDAFYPKQNIWVNDLLKGEHSLLAMPRERR